MQRAMVLSHLALLCKKILKTNIRTPFRLFGGDFLVPSLLCGLIVWAMLRTGLDQRTGVMPQRKYDRPELFRFETKEGMRFRSNEALNWKCVSTDTPSCTAIEEQMKQFCAPSGYGCFPTEMVFKNGKYINVGVFDGLAFHGNFTTSDILAAEPQMTLSSEEFELQRPLPYDGDAMGHFFGAVLHENVKTITSRFRLEKLQRLNHSEELYMRYMRPVTYETSSHSVLFSTSNSNARLVVYCILVILPMFGCGNLVSTIADERKSRIKEYLLTMGISGGSYHLHLAFAAFFKNVFFCIGAAIILFAPNIQFIFLFNLMYCIYLLSCINFSMLLTSFIHNPKLLGDIFFMVVPMAFMMPIMLVISRSQVALAFLSTINPGYAFFHSQDALRECSVKGGHLVWFADFPFVLPLGICLLLQCINAAIFISLSILVDHLIRTEFDLMTLIAKYKKGAWRSDSFECLINVNDHHHQVDTDDEGSCDLFLHESVHDHEKDVAIEIKDLHKTYPNGVRALIGTTVDIYQGQITVILGQNGAGKSTLFDVIAKATKTTSGVCNVNFPKGSFERISLCPQYSPAFPKLTVVEHLQFFAQLGGEKEWEKKAKEFMKQLKLDEFAQTYAGTLSGGNKRKLCIAIALIGKSEVILMDEPTAGVDTETRAVIKKFLDKKRGKKTIVITTHYTDEADDLADRVIIMAKGQVACSGSTSFLTKELSAGYDVTCVVKNKDLLSASADRVLNLAKIFAPAELKSMHGQEFCITVSDKDKERYSAFVRELEMSKEKMDVIDCGYSASRLDAAFVKAAEKTGSMVRKETIENSTGAFIEERKNKASKWLRMWNSLKALVMKRVAYELRNKFYQISTALGILVLIYAAKHGTDRLKPSEELNLLKLRECARIGFVDVPEIAEAFRRMIRETGDCIVIDEIDNITTWQRENYLVRPPIIGAVERKGADYTMVVATNRRLYEPLFAHLMYKAITNGTFDLVLHYQRVPNVVVNEEMTDITAKFVLYFTLLCLICRFIRAYVIEHSSGYAHLQLLTGTSIGLIWFAHFLVDIAIFAIYYAFLIAATLYFDYSPGTLTENIGQNFLCFLILLLQLGIFHRVFSSKNTANSVSPLVMTLKVGVLLALYMFLQSTPPRFSLEQSFPLFLDPIVAVLVYQIEKIPVAKESPGIIFVLFVQFTLFLSIFIALEYRPLSIGFERAVSTKRNRRSTNRPAADDVEAAAENAEDVEMELLGRRPKPHGIAIPKKDDDGVDAVPEGVRSADLVLKASHPLLKAHEVLRKPTAWPVKNITKIYNGNVRAVKGVTLVVQKNECFGLLGHNGAGKTSVFDMIAGVRLPTSGTAYCSGVDCTKPACIGYCPQEDALMGQLTGYQNLYLLASLYGYANPERMARILITCVGMEKHCDIIYKTLSGGQKRKFSVCAAMLATELIVLDEPTSGIDPMVRNDIWNVLRSIRDQTDTVILLTSHSMAEVEALCSRIGLMKQGLIVQHGSPQELVSKYGDYNKFEFKLPSSHFANELSSLVFKRLPTSEFVKATMGRYSYKIKRRISDSRDYWNVFENVYAIAKEMEEITDMEIDFTVVQCNLEDMFLGLNGEKEEKAANDAMEENDN
ncbi:hypothetical protein PRIPAC_97674 [Pristionchus pacificus]|uniref:ABC transporter ATP-binding protein n=1 Tax=Pristionchus pacificus TaxID=54126 RepID=A0A8R1Y854_PRIPA|nr:hypothetical protein PRIPAC_97674 [Pristionchus pacificus]|eukprot:PDM81732.1 ABC transporter ATP-binding protein [Pristionchus pacificus]